VVICRFLQSSVFGPEAIERMATAYENTLRTVRLNEEAGPVNEVIAKKIVEIAQSGERDPARITALALKQLGIPPLE